MKLVNLLPLKEGGAFGMSAKDLAATYSLKMLQQMRDETMRDMENDPSVEPEGGSQADYYGGTLNGLDQAIALKQPKKDVPYDVAVGKMTQDEYDKMMSTVKSDRDAFERSSYPTNQKLRMFRTGKKKAGGGLNESTESKWNSIDVSRKAEKEIDNKEWNERTAKKLEMLKSLNAAGKFKKDWDEEKLQGWVDQNYSWEKLSKQFKLNESYSEMYSEVDFEPEDMDNPDEDLVIIGSGYLDIKSNFKGRPNMTNDELATLGQKVVDQLHNGDKDAAFDYITSRLEEGSCGYGPDGVPGDTPGETKGMPADKRTIKMMREVIRKEIKKLHETK